MAASKPANPVVSQPATPAACKADYKSGAADRDTAVKQQQLAKAKRR
ncbi:hypothetical protein ACFU76_04640 [Streptomyces sp. NPDC057539]